MSAPTQTEMMRMSHRRAVQFFWGLLIGATAVSLTGNIAHAVLAYLPRVAVQISAAAVPPIALLAAVHGIGVAVRAGASGRVYRWALGAVATIGIGAFAMSFLALRELMQNIGYTPTTAWIFPAIVDTAVAVSTLMLVALGDKPTRRTRAINTSPATAPPARRSAAKNTTRRQATRTMQGSTRLHTVEAQSEQLSPPIRLDGAQGLQNLAPTTMLPDATVATELIASGATTQPIDTIVAVLQAHREGASIYATAKAVGVNYRTARRIVEGAMKYHQELVAIG